MNLDRLKAVRVRDHMATRLVLIEAEMEISRATAILIKNDVSGAPVVNTLGQLVGILTERDCIEVALQAEYYGMPGGLVRDVMTPDPESVSPDDNIFELANRLIQKKYRRYPVVEDGELVGLISRRDVMRAFGRLYPQR